ncbi:peptidase family M12A-domain-containing protein [Gamsiella multidivaricata]|uniref:peptidase family M12A-domain-containing protein n=1 Tax=Gamsiella multidivaricata TaxID=101098 RepID=UPI00221F55E5|nr:peptidase family M12A-domain-containing protein [Gamsiella multidivaricata]KAI7818482.1 peptidase family M12A-domain-containing protein [Gamsiella multidivaricata]
MFPFVVYQSQTTYLRRHLSIFTYMLLVLWTVLSALLGFATGQGLRFDRYPSMKWQYVPYEISSDFNQAQKRKIENTLNRWNQQVGCIKFSPRRNNELDYVFIFGGDGCWSHLGKIGGQQRLSLQKDGCIYRSTILRQLMHVVGFAYEHNRWDRDNYVELLWDNIPEVWESLYQKTDPADFGLQGMYDYYSLMHSDYNAPGTNKPAFRVKQTGVDNNRIGNGINGDLTNMDLQKIREQYC